MKIVILSGLICLYSCSASNVLNVYGKFKLTYDSSLQEDKALEIAKLFVSQESGWLSNGNIHISSFDPKYRNDCNESSASKREFGEFCNSQYVISYEYDTFCSGGARVLEGCENGTCSFKISKYSEECE